MSIPLASFVKYINDTLIRKIILLPIFIFICYLNMLQTKQYEKSILHYDSMTKEAYFSIFFKSDKPVNYNKFIQVPDYENAKKGLPERSSK